MNASSTAGPRSITVPRADSSRPGLPVLARLTARLTRARLASREGETLLYLASVLAYTVAICAALTVAGGTWMLYSRGTHPERIPVWVDAAKNAGYGFDFMASQYLSMSVLAPCWGRPWWGWPPVPRSWERAAVKGAWLFCG